jgi:hypothetical protein
MVNDGSLNATDTPLRMIVMTRYLWRDHNCCRSYSFADGVSRPGWEYR